MHISMYISQCQNLFCKQLFKTLTGILYTTSWSLFSSNMLVMFILSNSLWPVTGLHMTSIQSYTHIFCTLSCVKIIYGNMIIIVNVLINQFFFGFHPINITLIKDVNWRDARRSSTYKLNSYIH